MSEYEFSLVIAGALEDEATLDALFEAGCEDATFGQVDGVGYADFVREAPTFAEAVRSAIEQVELMPGLRVVRVEPDDLVTVSLRALRSLESTKAHSGSVSARTALTRLQPDSDRALE